MVITNSPDIDVLQVAVEYDLTGATPVINLTNQTTVNPNTSPVPDLADLIWVLNIYSPTGTPIFVSDFTTPWKDAGSGDWTTAVLNAATPAEWPRPYGNIEWSDYRIEFQVKDTVGNIYDLNKSTNICRPAGNNQQSTDTFGVVDLSVETLCDKAQLYIKDNTSKIYQGVTGTIVSTNLAVDYPRDPTGTIPAPFVITSFNTSALVPFTFNAPGYEATYYAIYSYDLGDNVSILIRYTGKAVFPVQCHIDLCPIACELKAFEDKIENGGCDDVQAAKEKRNKVSGMLLRAFIAKANPTCGIDLPELIEEIKAVSGFKCDCYGASGGIGSPSALIEGLMFDVVNEGGDVTGRFEVTGNNVVLYIKDRSYTFGSQGSCLVGANANILLVPFVGTNNTHVCLQVNIGGLAADIYTATGASADLKNQLNALIVHPSATMILNGKCIYSNGTCDYTYTLSDLNAAPTLNYIWGITINGVFRVLNRAFVLTDLAALKTYLDAQGFGTFTITNLGGGQVTIATTSNGFNLGDLSYVGAPNVKTIAGLLKNCSGSGPVSTTVIIQALIDYLCNLDDSQVATSQDYTVCWVDPATNLKTETVVVGGTALAELFATLAEKGCSTVDYIMTLPKLNCASIQNIFTADAVKVIQANDVILGTKGGTCSQFGPVELGTQILKYGMSNPDFMQQLCAAMALCNGGNICTTYSVFSISPVEHSPADNLLDMVVTFTNVDTISSLIRYARIDQGGDLNWSVPANVLPGASPYTISDLDDGQYRIGITPVYADGRVCAEITKDTPVCGTINAFSAALNSGDIEVTYSATSPKVKVTVVYPNGGSASSIYTSGDPISITPPSGLVGLFYVTMQPVCNETTGWIGASTAPVIIEITPADNSSVVNDSATNIANVTVSATNIDGSRLVLSSPLIASGGGIATFYLADGYYSLISINAISGSLFDAELVTGSGSYPLSGGGFDDVTVSGGIEITVPT